MGKEITVDATDNKTAEIISEKACLELFPVCRRTLANLRAKGIIPSIKIGGRRLYHWPSVKAALLRRQNGGAE